MAEKEKNQEQMITVSMSEFRKIVAEEVEALRGKERVLVRENEIVKKPAPKEKMVRIIPRSDDNRDTDVIVGSVNGVPFKVICDEENEVPESVAAVLRYSEEEDRKIRKAMRKKNDEWQKAAEQLK